MNPWLISINSYGILEIFALTLVVNVDVILSYYLFVLHRIIV